MKRYIALQRGFDNVKVREVGEKFEFAGMPGSWMKELDENDEPIDDAQKKKPGRPPKAE